MYSVSEPQISRPRRQYDQPASRQQSQELSPAIREVLHMLDALEKRTQGEQ